MRIEASMREDGLPCLPLVIPVLMNPLVSQAAGVEEEEEEEDGEESEKMDAKSVSSGGSGRMT